ncbi:hypothetical protein [Paragemmobacter aquarius]|nr:hypothetical protein [Gemmobacter aquarius]
MLFGVRVLALAVFVASSSQPARAGEAIVETLSCPIGNETVNYVGTTGCTYFQRSMSLKPITSCDFVDQVPQCPIYKFPMYRQFSEKEVERIQAFSKTDAYLTGAGSSRFYLAYIIENELALENHKLKFELLLNGFWYDSASTYKDDTFFDAAFKEGKRYIETTEPDQQAFIRAVFAFARVTRGEKEVALRQIERVRSSSGYKDSFLPKYLLLLEKCANKPEAPDCQPDYEFEEQN